MKKRKTKTLVVLGSGGHTTEMIHLLEGLDPRIYDPIIYAAACSDKTSIPRLENYVNHDTTGRWFRRIPRESSNQKRDSKIAECANVYRIPRAREVGQSYITSIFTTLHAFIQTLWLILTVKPELVLANGPGTCVPLIYTAVIIRLLSSIFRSGRPKCKVVFVESLCRVESLSLAGKLVYPIVDQFVVHWPNLKEKYPLVEVIDVFVAHDDSHKTG